MSSKWFVVLLSSFLTCGNSAQTSKSEQNLLSTQTDKNSYSYDQQRTNLQSLPNDMLLNELNDVHDVYSFVKYLENPQDVIQNVVNTGRSRTKIATPAGCKTLKVVVPLNSDSNPRLVMFPRCTHAERCAGCCSGPKFSCQPTEIIVTNVTVIKTLYVGGQKPLKYLGQQDVAIEEHSNCRCQCKIKASDCNAHQVYNARSCRCECRDKATAATCVSPGRRWDSDSCLCLCAFEIPCSTGLYFNHNTCSCQRYPHSALVPSFRHGTEGREKPPTRHEHTRSIRRTTKRTTTPSTTTPTTTTTTRKTINKHEERRAFLRRLFKWKKKNIGKP